MELPNTDQILEDVNLLFRDGLPKFMFRDDDSDFDARPKRLRQAYAYSWQKVSDYLLDPAAGWRSISTPDGKLAGFYSRLCDMDTEETLIPYARLAYLGLWHETERDSMVNGILYENNESRPYAIDVIRDELEVIASSGGFAEDPAYIARFIMSIAMSVHLTRTFMGEERVPDRIELETKFIEDVLKSFK